jgi:hypothetical protein
MTLTWTNQPLTRELARGLRAATRKTPHLDGHRFTYTDLKELHSAQGGTHLVLTHDADPVWQYWHRPPEGGIQFVCYGTRKQCYEAAEVRAAEIQPDIYPPGTYLIAWRPGGRTIRVPCLSKDPSTLAKIFEDLGYETNVEAVA